MRYLSYFFYIGINWSFPLAWFIIRHEIRGERKYGTNTTGTDDLTSSMPQQQLEHASIYQPVNFYTAERLFDHINKEDTKGAFIDMGCGKGRALAIAAAYGFTDIIGIDFSPKLCHLATQLADSLEERYPDCTVEIDCADARDYQIPGETSVIFLFNPFDGVVMAGFIERVLESLKDFPRPLKILYANPQCKKQWLDAGFVETYSFKKMRFLEGSVLETPK